MTEASAAADIFETHRPHLFGIAYRMTGSVMEAEDLVQETWLHFRAVPTETITSPRAYLAKAVTNQSINHLQSARMRRETYVGPWLPEPLPTDAWGEGAGSDDGALADSISTAFLLLLERLTPLERAAFLLHDVFDYSYHEIARFLDRSEAACRKLGLRAREHLKAERARFVVAEVEYERVVVRFLNACREGNMEGLIQLLAHDAAIYTDGGGKATAGTRPVYGQEIVAKFILGGLRVIADQEYTSEIRQLNGHSAIIVRIAGRAFGVVQFDVSENQSIGAIHFITNPDKIRHL